MDRKHFLKTSLCLGALSAARPLVAEEKAAAAAPPTPAPSPCERSERTLEFARRWVKDLLEHADGQLSESQRLALMEARGRACARGRAAKAAAAHKGNLDAFLAEIATHMGKDAVRREGDVVHVTYPTCFCPLVADFKEPLSASYCLCSVGWLKEVYEAASGKPVTVDVLETVKRGGKACRFDVKLQA